VPMGTDFSVRQLKPVIRRLLAEPDLAFALDQLSAYPARRAVNPLFTLILAGNDRLRWRAITAMGYLIARLFDQEPESARIIMRRLMWSLNDESGGIGWGAPESMGEALARSAPLAREYSCILISYAAPCGNRLEHPILQQGLLWGLGRFARGWPELAADGGIHLAGYLESQDPVLRGRAVWAAIPLAGVFRCADALRAPLAALADDPAVVLIYEADRFQQYTVGDLARTAASALISQTEKR